jgi:chorismate synthase
LIAENQASLQSQPLEQKLTKSKFYQVARNRVFLFKGTENGVTLGTPIGLFIANGDVKKGDYDPFKAIPRPGHADYTYLIKYGIKAESGGG